MDIIQSPDDVRLVFALTMICVLAIIAKKVTMQEHLSVLWFMILGFSIGPILYNEAEHRTSARYGLNTFVFYCMQLERGVIGAVVSTVIHTIVRLAVRTRTRAMIKDAKNELIQENYSTCVSLSDALSQEE